MRPSLVAVGSGLIGGMIGTLVTLKMVTRGWRRARARARV